MSLDFWKGAVSDLQEHTIPAASLGWVVACGKGWRFLLRPAPSVAAGGCLPAREPGTHRLPSQFFLLLGRQWQFLCYVSLTALAVHFWVNF